MMILRNSDYQTLAEKIKHQNSRVMIYGAGMIGQIVVPYFIKKYHLFQYIDGYVDMDRRKQSREIPVGLYQYKVHPPEILADVKENTVLLVTNSKFYEVVKFLDEIPQLNGTEAYLIPVMQLSAKKPAQDISVKRYTSGQVIPRKIHYCWFGRKDMPEFLQKNIDTWERLCPGYEIIRWDEDNYDVSKIPFMREAFEQKRYGFATDVARLDILYRYGGIYMDTDVTLLKGLDELLYQEAFVSVEKWGNINTGGGCGAVQYHPMIKKMLEFRSGFHFLLADGSHNTETNGLYETAPFVEAGMRIDNTAQRVEGVTVYPSSVFHPYDYLSCQNELQEDTFGIHHFYGGWMGKEDLQNRKNTQEKYEKILERIRIENKTGS